MANPSNSSSFVVQELLDGGAAGRTVELRGSGQPFRPATWKGIQKVVTTYFPGSPEATQQVLGAQDAPSEFEGMWRRTLLGRTPAMVTDQGGAPSPIVLPADLRELFDDIRARGRRLRVTWAATDGVGAQRPPMVREGRLAEFTVPHDRQDDIGWTMKFDWAGRGGTRQKVVATREGELVAFVNDVQAKANAATAAALRASLVAQHAAVPLGPTRFTLGQLEQLVDAPNKLLQSFVRSLTQVTSQLKQVGDIATKARNLPAQLANTSIAFARNTVAIANQFHDTTDRTPVELNAASNQLADLTRSTSYFWQTADAAHGVARSATQLRHGVTSSSLRSGGHQTRTILAVHIIRQGETLSSISFKYYQSTDYAGKIARANGLPWTTVDEFPRPQLIIPVLDVDGAS